MLKLITIILFATPFLSSGQCELISTRTSLNFFTQDCGDKIMTARISNSFTLQDRCGNLNFNPPGFGGPIITSTHDSEIIQDINIDPNPFRTYIDIKMDFQEGMNIAIQSITGQAIHFNTFKVSSKVKRLDLDHLISGFYIVTIYTDDKIIFNKKLIKI